MPLPPALAAKLARRGILTEGRNAPGDEEVIAESYDRPRDGVVDKNIDEFGHPLPPPWEKVWEPEFDTWYYWDTVTDKVSWLPPNDPDSVISYARGKSVQMKVRSDPMPRDRQSDRNTKKHSKSDRRRAQVEEEFDPMDPSSYSDAPKGSWRTGLKKLDDAKTGVDSTANGPLFQQRPYPSPGEVLSRNKLASQNYGPMKP